MTFCCISILVLLLLGSEAQSQPPLIARPDAFKTLVNPECSHCVDEAKRRAGELRDDDRVLAWVRGYSDGGAIPIRFFLNPYRVISDSYGVFVYDPDAGFARGFAPSYDFRFHGWPTASWSCSTRTARFTLASPALRSTVREKGTGSSLCRPW